jgi:hypothetical protein
VTPLPSVTVSPMPVPVRTSTAAAVAAADRKLMSSSRAYIARLSLLPSLTTKHDIRMIGGFRGKPQANTCNPQVSTVREITRAFTYQR